MSFLTGKSTPVQPQPAPPTIDTAVKNRDDLDRLRKRRGVLATIFGGSAAQDNAATATGSKTTLG